MCIEGGQTLAIMPWQAYRQRMAKVDSGHNIIGQSGQGGLR